jgi:FAD/FMN-containing dehydrogenase
LTHLGYLWKLKYIQGLRMSAQLIKTVGLANGSADVAALSHLAQILGPGFQQASAERAFYSQDVYQAGVQCEAVLRPNSIDQLQACVGICHAAGLTMVGRGGGLSYTDAYLPVRPNTVIFDLSLLDAIEEINETDAYVVVQCGTTWAKLYEALRACGLRTPFWGPLSGLRATIGGAISQGSVFLGSARYGSVGDSVLGLEIIAATGQLLRTGSWAADATTAPFMRYFGPDLTGLFIGDAGSLGFKTRVSLKLLPAHAHQGFLSFESTGFAPMANVMSQITKAGLASECFGFDPVLAGMRMQRASLMSDVKTLGQVLKTQGVLGGLKVVASGRRFLDVSKFSMHLCIEADSQAELSARMESARKMAKGQVLEIENAIPTVLRSQPFSAPNTILGPKGERWVPVHGVVPHSRALAAFNALDALLNAERSELTRLSIEFGYLLTTVAQGGFLIEPVFYWQDAQTEYHKRVVEPEYLKRVNNFPENLPARAKVDVLKRQCADVLRSFGATHFQLGKFYTYRQARDPVQLALLDAIRKQLDPKDLLNPGALC